MDRSRAMLGMPENLRAAAKVKDIAPEIHSKETENGGLKTMIKEITSQTLDKKKIGWRFDKKRQLFVTFQVDATFNGARHVRRGFITRREAREYLEQLKTQERLIRIGFVQTIERLKNYGS